MTALDAEKSTDLVIDSSLSETVSRSSGVSVSESRSPDSKSFNPPDNESASAEGPTHTKVSLSKEPATKPNEEENWWKNRKGAHRTADEYSKNYGCLLLLSTSQPKKILLDAFHKESLPILIRHEENIWIYGRDSDQGTKLTLLPQSSIYDALLFEEKPNKRVELTDAVYQAIALKKGHDADADWMKFSKGIVTEEVQSPGYRYKISAKNNKFFKPVQETVNNHLIDGLGGMIADYYQPTTKEIVDSCKEKLSDILLSVKQGRERYLTYQDKWFEGEYRRWNTAQINIGSLIHHLSRRNIDAPGLMPDWLELQIIAFKNLKEEQRRYTNKEIFMLPPVVGLLCGSLVYAGMTGALQGNLDGFSGNFDITVNTAILVSALVLSAITFMVGVWMSMEDSVRQRGSLIKSILPSDPEFKSDIQKVIDALEECKSQIQLNSSDNEKVESPDFKAK